MNAKLRRVLLVMVLGVALYGAYAVMSGLGRMQEALAHFRWATFALACALAFGNYVLRYLRWEFYLGKLGVGGIGKGDSFLTFLSGFVLTVTPGKVGEVFKSVVLFQTHGVAVEKTAPIVVAERVTDLIGIIGLILLGSLGFSGGLLWAGLGATVVGMLLVVISSRRLSMATISRIEAMPGPLGSLAPRLREAYKSLAVLVKPAHLFLPTLLALVAWALECLSLWVIVLGFGAKAEVALCAFFYATSTLAGALVPVPGGLGVTEGALQQQLTNLGGVEPSASTAAMILVRFATLWFAVFLGFVALSVLKRRHPTLLQGDENVRTISTPVP